MHMEDYIEGVPALTDEDVENGKRLLKNYIFVKNDRNGKKCYCSACGKVFCLSFPCRTYSDRDEALYCAKHRSYAACPKCGHESQVINRGRKKKLNDLIDRKAAMYVKAVSQDEVWFRCEFFWRRFGDTCTEDVRCSYEAYCFKKGEDARYIRENYYAQRFDEQKTIRDPFGMACGSMYGFCYFDFETFGWENLEKTFMRYCLYDPDFENHYNGKMRYAALFSRYPQIVEMLEKRGLEEIVEAKVYGHKVRHICDFNAKDYKKFWKITPEEVKALQKYNGDPQIAEAYKRLFRSEGAVKGMETARAWLTISTSCYYKGIEKLLKKYKRTEKDLIAYAKKQKHFQNYTWMDYIEAAEDLGYDLTVHNVIFPRDLNAAHDAAVETRRIKKNEAERQKAAERAKKIEKDYGFSDGGYLIRAPKDTDEIVAEGKALHHCVGGYAARHARGETTILFMRSVSEQDKPLYTIEIRGKKLIQAHGYQNIMNPKDVPEAQAFIDEWLAWVTAGSKRKKDGTPKIVKQEKTVKKTEKKGKAA